MLGFLVGLITATVALTTPMTHTLYLPLVTGGSNMAVPTTSILDDFDRANEEPLDPAFWHGAGGLRVVSNQAAIATGDNSSTSEWNTAFGPDCEVYVTVDLWGSNSNLTLFVRHNDGETTGYHVVIEHDGTVTLYRTELVGGNPIPTAIGTESITPQNGDIFRLGAVGPIIQVDQKPPSGNWTNVLSVVDSIVNQSGYIGINISGDTDDPCRLDDFGGGDVEPPETGTAVIDDFNRANQGPPPSAAWVTVSNGHYVLSNQMVGAAVGTDTSRTVAKYGPDCEAYITIPTLPADGDYIRLYVRYLSGASPGYSVVITRDDSGGDTVEIWSSSSLASFGVVFAAGDSIGISVVDTTITVYHKSASGSYITLGSVVNTAFPDSGYVAVTTINDGAGHPVLDDLVGGTIAGENTGNITGNGTGSTLIIHPRGLSDLTMGLRANEPYTDVGPYIVPLQTLMFSEEARQQAIYDEVTGAVIGNAETLVPVMFQVVIKHTTRQGMIKAYNALQDALLNAKGGTIEFKPENLGTSVRSTFYHYIQSAPPRLLDTSSNRWDAAPRSDGFYTIYVEVEFKTYPIATSDPDNPVSILGATTVVNWSSGYAAIAGSSIFGTLPALVRWIATPGASQYLGRLIMFKRNEGTLANFVCLYEAEDSADLSSGVWTVVSNGRDYIKCDPATNQNGIQYGIRFTIDNSADHEGRFAVFGVGYDDSHQKGIWTHQVKLRAGNIVQEGNADYEADSLHSWQLVYAGEFDLPITQFSDYEAGYGAGPYLEWYSQRAIGVSEFRLDAIILVYVADSKLQPSALDVACPDDGGVDATDESLLVENFLDAYGRIRELAHAIASSDGDFMRAFTTAPRGDFLMLEPGVNHRVYFVMEAGSGNADVWASMTILDDDFESYKGESWLPIVDMESDEAWYGLGGTSGTGGDTTHYVEGARSYKGAGSGYYIDLYHAISPALDLTGGGKFGNGDFITIVVYLNDLTHVDEFLLAFAYVGSEEFIKTIAVANLAVGYNLIAIKKSSCSVIGNPSWSHITGTVILLGYDITGSIEMSGDCLRMEKADPNNEDIPNATGAIWNFQPNSGAWTITEDIAGAGATLACLDLEAVEKVALIDKTTPNDFQFRARVYAKRDAGYVGIMWRSGQDTLTEGAEDCYAAILDIANDVLLVIEYADGDDTQLDNPAFTSVIDTWYTIGVIADGSQFKVYTCATNSLENDNDVFADANLLATVTDATYASGQCGVISLSTLGRFDEVNLVSLYDKMIPADEISVEASAIFRTIAPFCE